MQNNATLEIADALLFIGCASWLRPSRLLVAYTIAGGLRRHMATLYRAGQTAMLGSLAATPGVDSLAPTPNDRLGGRRLVIKIALAGGKMEIVMVIKPSQDWLHVSSELQSLKGICAVGIAQRLVGYAIELDRTDRCAWGDLK